MSDVPDLMINILTEPTQVSEFWEWLTAPTRRMVAVDTETTGLDWWSPGFQVRLIQFGDTEGGWAIPFHGWESVVRAALEWCSRARVKIVFHNVAFDSMALRAEGILLDWTIVEDTFVWASILGYADQARGLKVIAQREFGGWAGLGERILHTGMKTAGWGWDTVPLGWKPFPIYGVVDTCVTAGVWELFGPKRTQWQNDHDLEIAVIRLTGNMSWRGLPVDGAYLLEQTAVFQQKEDEIKAALASMGITNPRQNGQLEGVLKADGFDLATLTASGKAKLDKDVLEHIDHPAARGVLAYRGVNRMRVNYLQAMHSAAGNPTGQGLMHPTINAIEAATGRMSISNPPMQQLPSEDTTARRAIVPRNPGEVIVSSDYGQIELRLWGSLNKDKALVDTIKVADETNGDFFVEVGKRVYGEPDFVKKDPRRRLLKSTIYAKLFGGGIETAAATAGVNVYSLVPTWKMLMETFPSMEDNGNRLITTRDSGLGWTEHVATSPFGREFRVKDDQQRRKLPNYVTQGTAAIALKKAHVALDAAGFDEHMLLPVHDEVVFSIPGADAEDAMHEIAECMDSVIDPAKWGIAITAEPSSGPTWADAK